MENKELLENVGKLGLPLFDTEEKFDVNQTLAEVVKSKDPRLLEGFAVLLVNAVRNEGFNYEKLQNYLADDKDRYLLKELLLLSLGLYKTLNYYFDSTNYSYKKLSKEDMDKVENFRNHLVHSTNFDLMGFKFSPQRLTNVFTAYLVNEVEETKKQTEKREDFSFEYALSQVFSPKQKELFLKRVKGLNLTKTEREYFSRTVKKKLSALVNPELNRFAKLLLG